MYVYKILINKIYKIIKYKIKNNIIYLKKLKCNLGKFKKNLD